MCNSPPFELPDNLKVLSVKIAIKASLQLNIYKDSICSG